MIELHLYSAEVFLQSPSKYRAPIKEMNRPRRGRQQRLTTMRKNASEKNNKELSMWKRNEERREEKKHLLKNRVKWRIVFGYPVIFIHLSKATFIRENYSFFALYLFGSVRMNLFRSVQTFFTRFRSIRLFHRIQTLSFL